MHHHSATTAVFIHSFNTNLTQGGGKESEGRMPPLSIKTLQNFVKQTWNTSIMPLVYFINLYIHHSPRTFLSVWTVLLHTLGAVVA